jgi:hypothetical protein
LFRRWVCGAGRGLPKGGFVYGSLAYYNWFAVEFWGFALVQQEIAKAAKSFIEFPPIAKRCKLQPGSSQR